MPVNVAPLMESGAFPVLFNAKVCAALVDPTDVPEKVRLPGEKLTTGPVPVPDKLTIWGLPVAVSEIVTAAARVPVTVGENTTLILQLPPAASEVPQVFVWPKSPLFAPVTAIDVKLKVELPILVTVTGCGALVVPRFWLAKTRLVVVSVTVEPPPVPVRLKSCGLPAALSATATEAERVPGEVGVKVTLIVQVPPGAIELPQLLVCPKSPGFTPVRVKLAMFTATFPVFVTTAAWAAAVVPTVWLGKVKSDGARLIAEVVPVPEMPTICGLLLALLFSTNAAERVPLAEGVKVTLKVQLAPAATDPPQLSVSLKSPAFVPVIPTGGV